MEDDGGHPVNLTPDPLPGVADERTPAWSPDGSRIAYASNVGGTMDVWTMAPDGSDKQRQAALKNRPDLVRVRIDGTGWTPLVIDQVPGGSMNPGFLPYVTLP